MTTYKIPGLNGHDVVYALAKGRTGEIYLSASNEFTPGVCACIYAFDTRLKTFRKVIDFAQATGYDPQSGLMPHSKVHLALNSTSDGRCFAASHFTAPAIGQKGFDPIEPFGEYQGSWLVEYDPRQDRVIPHGCLLPGEGCRISTIDEKNECLYLLSYPRNHLFQYNYRERLLRDLGRIGQENAFGLEVDSAGNVFTTDDFGRILKYSFHEDRLEESDLFIPIKPGRRRQGNYARRMTRGVDGCLYGFGNKGSRLFRFSPETGELEDYGVVYGREAKTNYEYPNLPPPKALVQTDEQTLYIVFGGDGIYIDDVPIPNLVRFDLATRTAQDLGKFVDEAGSAAWIPQCALYCPEERLLYFGMQHTDGSLKLWETNLDPHPTTHRPRPTTHNLSFGGSIEGAEELPFVKASQVVMKELGWYGEGRVIPPGESAIQDLLMRDDVLYGITAGERSHLFRYAPYEQNRFVENYDVHVCDLGAFPVGPVIRARLLYQDRLLAFLETPRSTEVFAVEPAGHRPHYHSLPHWDSFPCRIVRLDCAAPFPEKTAILGTAPGKVFLHTATIELPEKWKIRCLTLGNSGRVYGFYGEDNGIGEAFAIDLATLKPERIGILQVPSDPRFWMCHRCDCACAGTRGEIYFGESDRISHLFIYHP